MKITILGSGTAVPSLERSAAGVLLQHRGRNYLFDCGYGAVRRLLEAGVSYHGIDRIFFTHMHPDHVCDLIIFLFASRYHLEPRTKDLTITGAPGFKAYYEGIAAAFKHWLRPSTYHIEIIEQDEETRVYDGLRITTAKTRHIESSRGYRITDERGVTAAISGDTEYSPEMIALGKDADLLILECSFPEEYQVAGHLTPRLAGQMAREAGCKRLCLTHFYPPCAPDAVRAACRQEFANGELHLAEDLMSFQL